ncbi:hypothetical protein GCM10010236_45220 [Streptomyces eurythermus]|nr:hypothetical protein GCM10010236_45220 [Streptomyces eurythermus]
MTVFAPPRESVDAYEMCQAFTAGAPAPSLTSAGADVSRLPWAGAAAAAAPVVTGRAATPAAARARGKALVVSFLTRCLTVDLLTWECVRLHQTLTYSTVSYRR